MQRAASKYVGGELRTLTDSGELTQTLLFQSGSWADQNVAVFQVLNTLLGQVRLQRKGKHLVREMRATLSSARALLRRLH